MNTTTKVIVTTAKAALLASALLSITIIILENESNKGVPIIFFISIIITFIISFIMILATIVPFNEFKPDLSLEEKFKKYFPFYAMVFFLGCFYIVYNENFEPILIAIFGIAYITAMQSWIWFFKQKSTLKNEDN